MTEIERGEINEVKYILHDLAVFALKNPGVDMGYNAAVLLRHSFCLKSILLGEDMPQQLDDAVTSSLAALEEMVRRVR
jgi:hypothetical protein